MRRPRVLVVSLSLVAGTLAFGMASSPASAHHVPCPTGNACIWAGTGWQTDGDHDRWVRFTQKIPNFANWRYGEQTTGTTSTYTATNNASSLSNRGVSNTVYFYSGKAGAGTRWAWGINTGDQDLSNGPAGSNNTIESGRFSCCPF